MQVATRIIPIEPSYADPLGHNTHLLSVAIRDETRPTPGTDDRMYLLYSEKDKTLGQITEDYAGRVALAEVLRNANASFPEKELIEERNAAIDGTIASET